MTLTLNATLSNDIAIEFIKQTLLANSIKSISNEKDIVENQINIKRENYYNCVEILNEIGKITPIVTINNEPNSVIVLFQ